MRANLIFETWAVYLVVSCLVVSCSHHNPHITIHHPSSRHTIYSTQPYLSLSLTHIQNQNTVHNILHHNHTVKASHPSPLLYCILLLLQSILLHLYSPSLHSTIRRLAWFAALPHWPFSTLIWYNTHGWIRLTPSGYDKITKKLFLRM